MKSLKIPTTQHRQGTHRLLRVLFFVIKGGNSISDPDIVLFKQSQSAYYNQLKEKYL